MKTLKLLIKTSFFNKINTVEQRLPIYQVLPRNVRLRLPLRASLIGRRELRNSRTIRIVKVTNSLCSNYSKRPSQSTSN